MSHYSQTPADLVKQFCNADATFINETVINAVVVKATSNSCSAAEVARAIRSIVSDRKYKTGEVYNALMLINVISRHARSAVFTQCIDSRFIAAVEDVVRDPSRDATACRYFINDMLSAYQEGLVGELQPDPSDDALWLRWRQDPAIHALVALRS